MQHFSLTFLVETVEDFSVVFCWNQMFLQLNSDTASSFITKRPVKLTIRRTIRLSAVSRILLLY